MPTVYLTRSESFCAAHQLWVSSWTEAQNVAAFGKCANNHFHGHNYDLDVTIKGQPDPTIGWLMDVKKLGELIRTRICDVLDHSNLNTDDSFLPKHIPPTTEILTVYIWRELAPLLPENCKLHCIKLRETSKIFCEYYGEE